MPVSKASTLVDWSTNSGVGPVDFPFLVGVDRAHLVHGLADDVEDPAEGLAADRHDDLLAGVEDLLAADQAVGGVHGDGAHGVLAEMLGDLDDQVPFPVAQGGVGDLEGVVDLGELAGLEFHVDDGTDDLGDFSFIHDEPFLLFPPASGVDRRIC